MASIIAESLIPIGNDVMAIRYYTMAMQMVYYYDYFLTLPDEVLFALYPFYDSFTVVLFAVTLKRKPIVVFFSVLAIAQSLMGMYIIVITARKQPQKMPGIPLQAYNLCLFGRSPHLELAYMSLSLFFDAMVFSVIVYVSLRTEISLPGGRPSILRTIFEDSTVYFLVIFSSHLLSLIMLLTTRPSLQLLPALGNNVYGRTFILRLSPVLTMSASRGEKSGWTSDALSRTHARTVPQIEFGHPSDGPEDGVGTTFDEMALSDLSGGQVREDNDEDAV
ncbi:hypothetical protein BDM02DRAFT_3189541 [Thelephora ganbajun]|uniref:Uncharacterized protein n=1 Tax=Thelephora ganbajun TaxID=370292 RepID=A0ACB6Z7V2_THEGA|nr:hypothetical protein BDM02DRAFT_3189541 [Thelephora ganbajun]